MKQGMKESYEKGVANRSAPSFALHTARCSAKRKQGYRWAGYRASKRCNQDADAFELAEGNTSGAISQVFARSCVVVDPRHAWKLHAREPGDLGDACCQPVAGRRVKAKAARPA
jgi:hypothetical protein